MPTNQLQIEYVPLSLLHEHPRSARRHTKKKLSELATSIQRLGFNCPLIVGPENTILAGHARAAAAKQLGMDEIPVIRVAHLSEVEARAFMLAENKFALNATWDFELLAIELEELIDVGFDPVLTGFSTTEIDLVICSAEEAKTAKVTSTTANTIPEPPSVPVSQRGDLWLLGGHRLLCGDARDPEGYRRLLGREFADIMFTDPPYNVPIPGHVSGLGRKVHDNFAMASGEMSPDQFVEFLVCCLSLAAGLCRDGSIAYVCMDWRHAGELIAAGKLVFSELKNLCVWNKSNGGMGAFYRSKHELIFVFKKGAARHTNNFGLGDTGRYRTNVWDYPGISSISSTRAEELDMHPTVKPVELVADALKDCSRRGDRVLDPFGGSGTTLIAAQKCGRLAHLIEYDASYCDVIVQRYQRVTGKAATLAATGETFESVAAERASPATGEAA